MIGAVNHPLIFKFGRFRQSYIHLNAITYCILTHLKDSKADSGQTPKGWMIAVISWIIPNHASNSKGLPQKVVRWYEAARSLYNEVL
jgi:hypothetical protein